jgi:hypothetical protein
MVKSLWIMVAIAWTGLGAGGAMADGNPLARGTAAPAAGVVVAGAWNGTDLEKRSACTNPAIEGDHGTYAEFDVGFDPVAHAFGIDEKAISPLNCTYQGSYTGDGNAPLTWSGTLSCEDGKHGTFTMRSIEVGANSLFIHLDVKLDTTETCTIEKVIAAGRLP